MPSFCSFLIYLTADIGKNDLLARHPNNFRVFRMVQPDGQTKMRFKMLFNEEPISSGCETK